ncbi:hypothetical protein [Chitinophaga polysaccharea]|uniref:hypothetical protein n=1 Tax=Chitinophaga polysaccharea TaxID=1293035 RepID=UPI00163C350B|nr:hypothetical protein [Chitinophaga polysaccharea]
MFSKFLKKKKEKALKGGSAKVRKSMKDYSKEDFFVKKVEAAKEVLGKWGLPNELSK